MKLRFFLMIFSFAFTISSYSQDSKFSIEVNYPITVDNNFIGENYNSTVDFGLKYRVAKTGNFNFGVGTNISFLVNPEDKNPIGFKTNATFIQPKVFMELNIPAINKLHPFASLGYTFVSFKSSGQNIDLLMSDSDTKQDGLNINFGLAYDVVAGLFVQIQYDYIKLNAPKNIPDTTFNTKVNFVKLGAGYRF